VTSSAWADALLVAVLLAPLAAVVLAVAAAVPNDDRRWTTGGCAIAALGSTVLLVAGEHPHVSRLSPDDLALAAAVATAVLALGVRSSARTPVVAAAVTVATCAIASGAPGQPSTVGPVLGIAAAVVLLTLSRETARLTTAAMSIGVVVVAAGVRGGGHGGAATVIIGAALVAIASSLSPRRAATVVVPLALLIGLRVAPALAGTPSARWLALVLALAGAVLALAPVIAPRFHRSPAVCAALVPWTLAAAVGPLAGMSVAARALATGAVLAVALGGPLALLAAAPGAAMLMYAVADGHGWPRPVLAVLLVTTVVGLTSARAGQATARLRPIDAVVLAVGAWFVLRPTSWAWARAAGLRAYTDGTVLAAAVALIAVVVVTVSGARIATERLTPWIVSDEDQTASSSGGVEMVMVAATVLMGLLAAALVRSASL
jgi:hypothetical protein